MAMDNILHNAKYNIILHEITIMTKNKISSAKAFRFCFSCQSEPGVVNKKELLLPFPVIRDLERCQQVLASTGEPQSVRHSAASPAQVLPLSPW